MKTLLVALLISLNIFAAPLEPKIDDSNFQGEKDAEIVIVGYSDFQCHFCAKGYQNTITRLLDEYKGRIKYIHKNLPLTFHKDALIAAKYYEAINLQDKAKGSEFHNLLFKNQHRLHQHGASYLQKLVGKMDLDLDRLQLDIDSKKISDKIERDIAEAKRFGFKGTPSYVVNGTAVVGAYPLSHFENIIEKK